jgi:hypothetical protein
MKKIMILLIVLALFLLPLVRANAVSENGLFDSFSCSAVDDVDDDDDSEDEDESDDDDDDGGGGCNDVE